MADMLAKAYSNRMSSSEQCCSVH